MFKILIACFLFAVDFSVAQAQDKSVPATEAAEAQARKSLESEIRNNSNAGAATGSKGAAESTIYPKSARPDVEDSYHSDQGGKNKQQR